VNEFNVVALTMVDYLQKRLPIQKVHCVPGAVYEERTSFSEKLVEEKSPAW
jgi:hypothetical protein